MRTQPMLAATIESKDEMSLIRFPAYVSPKYDGVRGLAEADGRPYSRKGEDFANVQFYKAVEDYRHILTNKDFEIVVGQPNAKNVFTKTNGYLASDDAPLPDDLTFLIFDEIDRIDDFTPPKVDRISNRAINVLKVPQHLVNNIEELLEWEEHYVKFGYEGVMVRAADSGPYKRGRASMKSQQLMKFKRFEDAEGVIVGFEEQMQNNNVATKDAFGRTKRSSSKANKTPNGHMGKMLVKTDKFSEIVKIGTGKGLTKALRKTIWENQDDYLGRTITFEFQGGSDYVKPRFASFKGFRDEGY